MKDDLIACRSGILYARASLSPLAGQIRAHHGIQNFLRSKLDFNELLVPHFYGNRPFWRPQDSSRKTNSGALGKAIAKMPNAYVSNHPTHAFAGYGERVIDALKQHTPDAPCFAPIKELAEKYDFSMLLVGCLAESPGFSTVHAAQQMLGLTQKHLIRYLLRWDFKIGDEMRSKIAPECPGCSSSFDKFYPRYEKDGNLVRGKWDGVSWIFIPSALRALEADLDILRKKPRFVDCGKRLCPTCGFRLY